MGARWDSFLGNVQDFTGSGIQGGLTGGAVGGPWGALAGLGLGLGSTLLDKFRNRSSGQGQNPQGYQQMANYSPEQMQFQNQLLQQLGPQVLQGLPDFGAEEDLMRRNFNTREAPGLQQQLTQMGATPSGSGWQQAQSDQRSNFELGLGALKRRDAMNQRSQNINLLQQGLRPQYSWSENNQQPSFSTSIQDILGGLKNMTEARQKRGQKGYNAPLIDTGSSLGQNFNNISRVANAERLAQNQNMAMFNKPRLY